MSRLSRLLPLLLPIVLFTGVAAAAPAPAHDRSAAAQQKLTRVRQQIRALAAAQRKAASERDRLGARLASQADAVAAAARALRHADAALATQHQHIQALQQQQQGLQQKLSGQRQALAVLLRAAYQVGAGSDLRLLLGDRDVERIARALTYSRYFQRDRLRRIHALLGQLAQLQQVQQSLQDARRQLQARRSQRRQRLQSLQDARRHQQQLLAQAEAKLKSQQARLAALKRHERNLDQLVQRLRDVFADIPGKLPSDVPFARLRGRLPWPASGRAHRSGPGEVIAVPHGSQVHAVAHGRIAYAAWLRGYGMLVIVDHGHGWMTLYGNNESLLHGVGDWVDAGEVLATSGAGADGRSGVYFELRHDGKPVNPQPWLRRR